MAYVEKNKKVCVIYKITSPSDRVYIGQTNNFKRRLRNYNNYMCKGQTRLYASFKKYGVENHKFEIIKECLEQEMNEFERFFQEKYDVLGKKGLNCKYQKTNGKSGKLSEETRSKISKSNKGRKIPKEQIERHRAIMKGRKLTPDHVEILRKVHTGKIVSKETRKKMSEARMGWKPSSETIDKFRANNLGKILSEETKLKIGANQIKTKKVINIETKEIYQSIRQAALKNNIPTRTMQNWMSDISPNKSNFRILCI
jgi:group I intron endonuclease